MRQTLNTSDWIIYYSTDILSDNPYSVHTIQESSSGEEKVSTYKYFYSPCNMFKVLAVDACLEGVCVMQDSFLVFEFLLLGKIAVRSTRENPTAVGTGWE